MSIYMYVYIYTCTFNITHATRVVSFTPDKDTHTLSLSLVLCT